MNVLHNPKTTLNQKFMTTTVGTCFWPFCQSYVKNGSASTVKLRSFNGSFENGPRIQKISCNSKASHWPQFLTLIDDYPLPIFYYLTPTCTLNCSWSVSLLWFTFSSLETFSKCKSKFYFYRMLNEKKKQNKKIKSDSPVRPTYQHQLLRHLLCEFLKFWN